MPLTSLRTAATRALSTHRAFLVVLALAIVPLFGDLGGDYLWADEGDTAVLASSILKTGVPTAWDGVTFSDSDFGSRLNDDLVMVSHPWLQYYVAAASFAIFGETTFAARAPFALAGWLTIVVLYLLVYRLTSDRRAALGASILLGLSVPFLLFARQSRNYSLYLLFGCVVVLLFLRLTSARRAAAFSAASLALLASNPAGLALLAALGLLTAIHKPSAPARPWFWRSMAVVAMVAVPWLLIAQAGVAANTTAVPDWARVLPRLMQFLIEWTSVTPAIGAAALLAFLAIRLVRQRRTLPARQPLLTSGERTLVAATVVIVSAYAALMVLAQSRADMFELGLRYAIPLIPLTMAVTGVAMSKVSAGRARVWVALLLVFGLTKAGRLTPWMLWSDERLEIGGSIVAIHVPATWINGIFRLAPVAFAEELWRENPGTVADASQFLQSHAAPSDIVITNYEWEALYFHTRLPQGLKVMPDYPVYPVAREHGLPDYVFSGTGARWIVWRWTWDGYRGYKWTTVRRTLEEQGATVTLVSTIRETAWENRENVHFRRFPDQRYLYRSPTRRPTPDAEIFRVDWPNRKSAGGAGPQRLTKGGAWSALEGLGLKGS